MKVLISCYACSPYKGSEPGMGWNFVRSLSRKHELHIITETKFKEHLDKYFEEHPNERSLYHFYFVDRARHKLLRKIWPPSYYWFYNDWQKKVLNLAKNLEAKEHFDLIHQLNMVGYREPGYLYKMNKPLVWGPIGGFNITPWRLLHTLGIYGGIFYFGRNIINTLQMYCNRRVRMMMRTSDTIISASQDTYDALLKIYHKDTPIIPEVGLLDNFAEPDKLPRRSSNEKLRIVWCGQHTPSKALNIVLNALADCPRKDVELHVIGEGKYTKRWKALANKLELKNVVWHGWVTRKEAINIMKSCHLMTISSLADLTSTVLLEALSFGVPVIAMDHCGFSNVITKECGIKIKVQSLDCIVKDFSFAIALLCENEEMRFELSKGALNRALEFSWDKKAEEVDAIYKSVVN